MIWFGHEVRRCQVTGSGGRRQRLLRVLAGISLVSATAVGIDSAIEEREWQTLLKGNHLEHIEARNTQN